MNNKDKSLLDITKLKKLTLPFDFDYKLIEKSFEDIIKIKKPKANTDKTEMNIITSYIKHNLTNSKELYLFLKEYYGEEVSIDILSSLMNIVYDVYKSKDSLGEKVINNKLESMMILLEESRERISIYRKYLSLSHDKTNRISRISRNRSRSKD